jgi:predicted DsbA family dithiol-disulfide isomerase
MRIEIWADVTCPWAFVAKRRLESALTVGELADDSADETADIVWRPFRIDPTAPDAAEPLDEELRDPVVGMELRRADGKTAPERVYLRMSDVAAEAGIEGGWRPEWRVRTHDAQRLLFLAYEHGGTALQNAVDER